MAGGAKRRPRQTAEAGRTAPRLRPGAAFTRFKDRCPTPRPALFLAAAWLLLDCATALADETVTTTDGRRLLLRDDGRYEVLAPAPEPSPQVPPEGPLGLTDLLDAPPALLGRTVTLETRLRLFGGRALAVSPEAPGRALPVDLATLDDRSAIIRACSEIAGCPIALTGVLRRNANGPFLDAREASLD